MISYGQGVNFQRTLDSIHLLRKLGKDNRLSINDRLIFAKKDSILSYQTGEDSLKMRTTERLSYLYNYKNDYINSIKLAKHSLNFACKTNDSLVIAYTHSTIGHGYAFLNNKRDSSYYYLNKSLLLFKNIKQEIVPELLAMISWLRANERDYISSDSLAIKAINLIKDLPENDENISTLGNLYNLLGLNANHQKSYYKSFEYFNKTLLIYNKASENSNLESHMLTQKEIDILYTKINIAELYRETKEPHKALSIYNKLIKKNSPYCKSNLLKKDPLSYAAIANNMAYNLYLSKNNNLSKIKTLFNEAYNISDSLNADYEIAAGGNDMAEFYNSINQKDSALVLSKKSYQHAKKIKDFFEVSRSLLMLSKLEEGEKGKEYLYEHIKLNDSLLDLERASRNKFARIQFETDSYIEKTKKLNSQNVLISIIIAIIVFVLVLLYIIRIQIGKNQKLVFAGKQQKANEHIYTLIMNQQAKVEETRLSERYTVSEQLNNGILNKLMGSRFGLEILSMSEKPLNKETYKYYITELQHLEKEIRDISHSLKKTSFNDDTTYISLIEDYLEKQNIISNFKYDVNLINQINWQDINDDLKIDIFKIIQEITYGIIKHKNANTLTLNFSEEINQKLRLEIITNLDFSAKRTQKKRRLKNIKHIVSKQKGTYMIERDENKHVCIALELPIPTIPL